MATVQQHIRALDDLLDDRVDRAVLTSHQAHMQARIFNEGRNSQGNRIGEYSEGYQRTRRKKNYPTSNKVILQATGPLLNDYSLIQVSNAEYGIGFKNSQNGLKRKALERRYGKIFRPTKQELRQLEKLYSEAVRRYIR